MASFKGEPFGILRRDCFRGDLRKYQHQNGQRCSGYPGGCCLSHIDNRQGIGNNRGKNVHRIIANQN